MAIDSLGRFVKGSVPHNKRDFVSCRVPGCERTDHKAHGYCTKHHTMMRFRKKKGQPIDDISLSKRVPRTKEHVINNLAYIKSPNYVSPLKGKTYVEIYGDKYEEHKMKHQKSLIGVNKGKPSKLKGKPSGRTAWNKGINYASKEKNPFWKGGSSYEKYGYGFTSVLKESVRNRDGRKCVCCECPEIELGKRLSVHHIDENKNNNVEDNLVSLCQDCHIKIHWSKKDWANFLKDKLSKVKELLCR